MLPVLFRFPSKILFAVTILLALGIFVTKRVGWSARGGKGRSSLYLLAGAWYLLWSQGNSVLPSPAVLRAPWDPITIYSYTLMLGLALVSGWFLAMRFARQDGLPVEYAGKLYLWTTVGAFLGARILYLVTVYREFESVLDPALLTRGGLVAYGGMLGGLLVSGYLCWKWKIRFLRWADAVTPSVLLGTAITRLGCFLFGCDFGRRATVPWAIRFPAQSPAWVEHVAKHQLSDTAPWSFPVHPTQLYESLAGLVLFVWLLLLRRSRPFCGRLFVAWVAGYGVLRSIIEIYRGDSDRGSLGPLSTSQIIGVLSSLAAIGLLFSLIRRHRGDPFS